MAFDLICHHPSTTLEQSAAAANVDSSRLVRAVMLQAGERICMAVLAHSRVLDFQALTQRIGFAPVPLAHERAAEFFPDCEFGCIPPVGFLYDIPTYYDADLQQLPELIFEGGAHNALVRIPQAATQHLWRQGELGRLSLPLEALQLDGDTAAAWTAATPPGGPAADPGGTEDKLFSGLYRPPSLPQGLRELLQRLRDHRLDPQWLIGHLAAQQELAQRLLAVWDSGLLGSRPPEQLTVEAMTKHLGVGLVAGLAVGLQLPPLLNPPPDGPLGLCRTWQHGVLSGVLAYQLAKRSSGASAPAPEEALLAGMLHDAGLQLYGHLFRPEFYLLNRLTAAHPEASIKDIEKRVLCMGQARELMGQGHASAGARLLTHWRLPDGVVAVAHHHHDPVLTGEHASLVRLVAVADHALSMQGLGDADQRELPAEWLSALQLSMDPLLELTDQLLERGARAMALIEQWTR